MKKRIHHDVIQNSTAKLCTGNLNELSYIRKKKSISKQIFSYDKKLFQYDKNVFSRKQIFPHVVCYSV